MSNLGWEDKGYPWPLKLIYSHCLIWFNISSFGLNFKKKSHLNALGSKLGRPHIPNATYQVPRSSTFWFWRRRFFNGFYHICAWRPSWLCGQNILHKFLQTYHKESSHEILVQLGQWFVRKLCFNILMGLHMSDLSWKIKGQPWPFELIYSHCLIRWNISSENND